MEINSLTYPAPLNIFSIDVEDWFHILDVPSAPAIENWHKQPSLVERNFNKLLDLLEEYNVKSTCFFLAWVAERFPHLVKRAQALGHEIASHGYAHRLVYEFTSEQFYYDSLKAKKILEDITGVEVKGYRASGFSVTEATPWFFDELFRAGYTYDSSVFPAPRGHGGMRTENRAPYQLKSANCNLLEFPITVSQIFGKQFCFFGGGYLRLFPWFLIESQSKKVNTENRPVVFYIHPREIDPKHPRLPMSRKRQFKTYINLRTTETKLRNLFTKFKVTSFQKYIEQISAE